MKHKTATLEGALLDAAVAKAEGHNFRILSEAESPIGREVLVAWPEHHAEPRSYREFEPSADWGDGGPIIEREGVYLWRAGVERDTLWAAGYSLERWKVEAGVGSFGPTPLIAAMRAYVASKFGAEVELP
jgi:hypothetical protein